MPAAASRPAGPVCSYCGSHRTAKRGKRYKKLETLQLYLCRSCGRTFSIRRLPGRTYPARVILNAISWFSLGYKLREVSSKIRARFGIVASPQAIHSWARQYEELCTYRRLKAKAKTLYPPQGIVRAVTLHHQQVYRYRIHLGKLDLIFEDPELTPAYKVSQQHLRGGHRRLLPLKRYLLQVADGCPHELFGSEHRASQFWGNFNLDEVLIVRKKPNDANHLAELALQASPNNRMRHDALQKFFLANDSATVAVEVPVWLTPEDIKHFKERLGFRIPFELDAPLTGHIDFVQVRNGNIHILDYKPDAAKERHAHEQLTFYALALSRRTGLKVSDFRCAWFDERDYYEFLPLSVVMKRGRLEPPSIRSANAVTPAATRFRRREKQEAAAAAP